MTLDDVEKLFAEWRAETAHFSVPWAREAHAKYRPLVASLLRIAPELLAVAKAASIVHNVDDHDDGTSPICPACAADSMLAVALDALERKLAEVG